VSNTTSVRDARGLPEAPDPEFLEWAHEHLVPISNPIDKPRDLTSLGRIIGDATIVALGEGLHGIAEPLELRNELLQYLVEEKDFTAVALESGLTESRLVHEYVRGGPGEPADIASLGIGWNFASFSHNHALITSLRQYNSDPRHARKINFYGFDVPGSPGDPTVQRGLDTALREALHYLTKVDASAAAVFRARLTPFLPHLRFDYYHQIDGPSYDKLVARERDILTAAIADLLSLFERNEARYIESGLTEQYEWAHRAVIGARQVDSWLRQIPLGWCASLEHIDVLDRAADLRDRSLADNLEWILRREGPQGRLLVFAHNAHLSVMPVRRTWWSHDDEHCPHTVSFQQQVAGTHLRRLFGKRLFTLGNLIGRCETRPDRTPAMPLHSPPQKSVDALFGEVRLPSYVLDLRAAPQPVSSWLGKERQLGPGFEFPGKFRGLIELSLSSAFDAVWYLDVATPAPDVTNALCELR
jgi:erythromycin esterase